MAMTETAATDSKAIMKGTTEQNKTDSPVVLPAISELGYDGPSPCIRD